MQTPLADALAQRRWADAERLLAPGALADESERWRLLAVVRLNLGRLGDALAAADAALALAPHSAAVWTNRGSVLRRLGRIEEAAAAFERAADLDTTLAAPCFNLGKMLVSDARLSAARAPLQEAVRRDPAHVDAWIELARVDKALGEIPAAVSAFRRALALRPTAGAAWWGLANLKTLAFDAQDCGQLDALWARTALPREERVLIGYARAHAHLAGTDDARAWQALVDANDLRRAQIAWDRGRHTAWVNRLLQTWPTPRVATGDPTRGAGCVFVVGLPRSGSTLVEQVLAAHSQVAGASELPDLQAVLRQASADLAPEVLAALSAEDYAELGERYLARTRRWRSERPWMVDKTPSNFLYLGALRLMLPGARVIDVRRDLRDTAYSCYLQYFAQGAPWSNDLADLRAWCADYTRLMEHWDRQFPGEVLRLRYEQLVAAPQQQIAALLAALGLPQEAACFSPHEVRREVRTASAAQVKQPIDQRGIGRWRRYAQHYAEWPGVD